ncbi:MAG: DUF4442 domain-containing protein [Halomonadaceae bacterium]|nr:MAG: DUF4442 domain-containing protein [Halomonadaceae bacterium]
MLNQLSPHLKQYFHQLETQGRSLPGQARLEKRFAYPLLNGLIGFGLPFTRRNGFTIEALRHGYLRARMPIKGNKNHMGTVYAGAQFLLAEVPFGALSIVEFEGRYIPILRELSIRFLQPARSDLILELELDQQQIAEVVKEAEEKGKANLPLSLALQDSQGAIVATAEADYQIRAKL